MYMMQCTDGESFLHGALARYSKLELDPSAAILNYGQGLLEGLKAQRAKNGQILLFRPEENGLRMKMGAERLCMPSPSVEQFVDALRQTVLANQHWFPPPGKGSLYVRPLLIGSGPVLRMGPVPEYTFLVYASLVSNLHKGQMSMKLVIQDKSHRATPGGTGGIKSITNYSPVSHRTAKISAHHII
ncbi:branched-chain amino acid aminotransferase 2, chloroplastic-like [Rhodamnia argentea]|uniref:Branched-chain amino acid aminotransferase 2, chloroplastic-like n=1 Tax=Rhodamnia argentea TaxID=178133 RepID=A0ABM3HE07_9MYRT|nr:branched-chain amino acid aminotransferase 2, chloroplastic-like [Rhodamnia argentea]